MLGWVLRIILTLTGLLSTKESNIRLSFAYAIAICTILLPVASISYFVGTRYLGG
jgi:hypothetical protein